MKKIMNIMMILLWAVIFLFAHGNVMAQSKSIIDVALAIDSSGSMKKTDPKSLRIPAAKLFISLLGSNDRAAVLSFSDQGYPIADLTTVNSTANKNKLLSATEKITSKGLHTNLYGAFNKGMEVLLDAKEDGREQIIVLMSDGMMDVGDPDKDRQFLAKLKSELSGELKKNNIKVYSIAFTDQSDRRLLEKISKQTDGFYNLALTDKDFHLIFTSIFESLKSPEMLPMEKNSFLIDGSIREVTIVVSRESAATDIQINAPDGQQYSGNKKYSGISWFVSDNFDMITVQNPVEGRWEILYSTGENNRAYIITDLKLETNFEQLYAVFGENLDIKAWLEKEGTIIRDGEVLETTNFSIELKNPDGNISNLKPLNSGDGIFQKNITPYKDGNYKLRVIAKGKTYEREKAFLFNVANLQESKEDLIAEREARKAEQAEAQEYTEEEEQVPVNWAKIIIQFISINLIIGILVVVYMKRHSIKDFKLISKLFKRSKDSKSFQAKKKEPEVSDTEAECVTEESAQIKTGETTQVSKEQIALDDTESDGNEVEQGNEEEDKEPVKERIALEEAASEDDNSNDINNLEEEIQRLEKLNQQEGKSPVIETIEDTASVTEEPADQAPKAEPAESTEPETEQQQAVDAGAEEIAQSEEKDEEESDADMWAEAFSEQAASESEKEKQESTVEQKAADQAPKAESTESTEPETEQQAVDAGAEETAQAEEKDEEESDADMWAEAFSEQAASESEKEKQESTVEQKAADQAPKAESTESTEPETEQQAVDAGAEETAQAEDEEAESIAEAYELDEETQLEKGNKAAETQAEEHEVSTEMKSDTHDTGEDGIAGIDQSQEVTGAEDDSEEDADQMWTKALREHAEAEEEKISDSKDKPEGSPSA